jgi:hypothetical protein
MEKVAKFQPDMVKIQFAARIVANLSQSTADRLSRVAWDSGQHFVGGRLREPPLRLCLENETLLEPKIGREKDCRQSLLQRPAQ